MNVNLTAEEVRNAVKTDTENLLGLSVERVELHTKGGATAYMVGDDAPDDVEETE